MSQPTATFTLDDGSAVVVESVDAEATDAGTDIGGNYRRVARDGSAERAQTSFQTSVERIRPAAQVLLDSLKELNTPEEINLEFGIKFSAKAGAIIASADSEAVFKVAIKWTNPVG